MVHIILSFTVLSLSLVGLSSVLAAVATKLERSINRHLYPEVSVQYQGFYRMRFPEAETHLDSIAEGFPMVDCLLVDRLILARSSSLVPENTEE